MNPELKGFLLVSVLKMLVVFTITMLAVAYMTFMERKVSAWMQNRLGPNRLGPRGWFQPIADGIKNLLQEETLPRSASLAPSMRARLGGQQKQCTGEAKMTPSAARIAARSGAICGPTEHFCSPNFTQLRNPWHRARGTSSR